MTEDVSVFLEFKPVGNILRIINKANMFSFDQMSSGHNNNNFQFIPVQNCNDNWASNINTNGTLKQSAITKCTYLEDGSSSPIPVDPPIVELIASYPSDGGVIVDCNAPVTIQFGSNPQDLKGVFLVNADNDVVVSYCILPEKVRVNRYLQLTFFEHIIEITPTTKTTSR